MHGRQQHILFSEFTIQASLCSRFCFFHVSSRAFRIQPKKHSGINSIIGSRSKYFTLNPLKLIRAVNCDPIFYENTHIILKNTPELTRVRRHISSGASPLPLLLRPRPPPPGGPRRSRDPSLASEAGRRTCFACNLQLQRAVLIPRAAVCRASARFSPSVKCWC